VSKEGTHPIAFVAAGANANLFESNIILGRGDNGTGFGCDDASPPTRRVATEARLMQEPTDASSEFAWLAYDGRWGERAPWEFNGPTGPNDKRAWREPFSWQEDLRPSSISVPKDSIGPNAVNVFCDAVWVLSTPLAWLFRVPPFVMLAGVAVTGAGAAYLATRTRYRPAVPLPLRQRRRFGQLLRAARRVYWQNLALFIGIGLVFVPAGFLESLLQWALFSPPFLDTVAGYFSADFAVEVAIALAIGNVASSVVFWFVAALTTAAVGRIEEGRGATLLHDYAAMLRRIPALIIPRLKAFGIIVLLAVSVVGIPWAIRNGIRWAFIEETMLLDATAPGDARASSARAVQGRWWHTFACLVTLSIVGYGAGPALGIALLLLSPLAVSTVNIISSLAFVLVAPFVGIAQGLLYFGLKAPPEAEERRR
jgi:hypothetical protein